MKQIIKHLKFVIGISICLFLIGIVGKMDFDDEMRLNCHTQHKLYDDVKGECK